LLVVLSYIKIHGTNDCIYPQYLDLAQIELEVIHSAAEMLELGMVLEVVGHALEVKEELFFVGLGTMRRGIVRLLLLLEVVVWWVVW
jgi:hypothetical protein